MTRRELIAGLSGLAAATAIPSPATSESVSPPALFPRKGDFQIPAGVTYLNSAYTHPLPTAAVDAIHRHALRRARPGVDLFDSSETVTRVKADFAALISCKPDELAFIGNTSTGENLVVAGLGIGEREGNVVTDGLHFDGAILHLQALQRRGLDLRIVMPKEGRIELADLARAIDGKTRLVEVSFVAMYNGFQHDLKAVCDLAHDRGAHVYADIIQGVGAAPLDVRATGVDFCAASGFKWLMGDFGLGFLYCREELLDRVVARTQFGYHSAPDIATHFLASDQPGPEPFSWEFGTGAAAHFEVGSRAAGALAAYSASLPYIRQLGVGRIEAWRRPMLRRLRDELPRLGFKPLTPAESTSPLISFTFPEGQPVAERLKAARINARVGPRYLRISPSVFNDLADIDRLIAALA